MTLFSRAATLSAAACGIAAIIGGSTPGFAFDLAKPLNVQQTIPVPPPVFIPGISPIQPTNPAATDPVPLSPREAPVTADDAAAYASLAAAVAAHDVPPDADRDLTCMAGAIYFEAKGEPLIGQLAVAEVILNRAKSGRFPKSICSVITQRGQFSFVRGGRIPSVPVNLMYRTAMAVAQVAMAEKWESPAPKALFFHARRVSPGWRMTKIASIGNHVFYR